MESFNLNIIPGKDRPVCHASQYDIGRTIRVNLFEGFNVFTLDGTEVISGTFRELMSKKFLKLSGGHARALLPLSPSLQEQAAATVLKNDLSVRQTELLVKKLTAEKREKAQ